MIYSASRRTDLVAFYPDFTAEKIGRARKLEAVVFWTKDPRNLCAHAGLFAAARRYPAAVQLTVTGLAGTAWEPGVPPPERFAETLRQLAAELPAGAVQWRFDPVLPCGGESDGEIVARCARVAELLRRQLGELDSATISFPDAYGRAVERAEASGLEFPWFPAARKRELAARIAETCGLRLRACCEPELEGVVGVAQARCVDGELFDRLYGTRFGKLKKDYGQRKSCGCAVSTDIGSYRQLCRHNCRYCYACPEK